MSSPASPQTLRLAWVGAHCPPPAGLLAPPAVFEDSDDFLLSPQAFEFDLYVVVLQQPGVAGADLLRLLRKRSSAVVLALGPWQELVRALDTGADMLLPEQADAAQLNAALRAVQRRSQPVTAPEPAWTFDATHALLIAPGGQQIALSESEQCVMRCFAEADGLTVPRSQMMQNLWGSADPSMDNALHATVYRLRRRIEQAGCAMAPIQSVSRVGYSFRAPLVLRSASPAEPAPLQAASPGAERVLQRHHVQTQGSGEPPLLLVHGFGCDQSVWRRVAPTLAPKHRLVLMDLAGYGGSPPASYDFNRHASLAGHAEDLIEVCQAAGVKRPVLVGHSVGAMVALKAAVLRPTLFRALVLVAPSPSLIDDGDYRGGFQRDEVEQMLAALDNDYLAWAEQMAPLVMGRDNAAPLQQELAQSFCRAHPAIAPHFARTTFLTDCRADLPLVRLPTLVLQCSDDPLAPRSVGDYTQRQIPESQLRMLQAQGHCPHVSAPEETAAAIADFVAALSV